MYSKLIIYKKVIFLSSTTLIQHGREDLEVPDQGLVSLQIPGVETG